MKSRLFFIAIFFALLTFACSLPALASATQTPVPSDTPEPTETRVPTSTHTPLPTFTPPPIFTSTPVFTPTTPFTPTPVPQPFYLEEFRGDLSKWSSFITSGSDAGYSINQDNDGVLFTIDNTNTYVYLVNNEYNYTDVRIDAHAWNRGVNTNNVTVICRYSNAGWYEFSAFSSGWYYLYYYDGNNNQYISLAEGGIRSIRTGQHDNTITAICKGDRLTFIVNDVQINSITDSHLSQGEIGISASSLDLTPVEIYFDWLQISQP
jgi:hypothetical protein